MVKWNSLIYVHCEDHEKRYMKKSFTGYQKVIASNGEKL